MNLTKRDMVEDYERRNPNSRCDYARPADWDRHIRELGIEPDWYVWEYNAAGIYGQPLNVLEAYMRNNRLYTAEEVLYALEAPETVQDHIIRALNRETSNAI